RITRWVVIPQCHQGVYNNGGRLVPIFEKLKIRKMNAADIKLRERVKELKCLYDLSKIALKAGNDVSVILNKTLEILPDAMQFPNLAEVSITYGKLNYTTKGFSTCKHHISSSIGIGNKKVGALKVGYRAVSKKAATRNLFLTEEKNLIKIVAR